MTCKHDWHFIEGTDRLRCQRCHTVTGGIDWSKLTIPTEQLQQYKLHDPRPNSIKFYNGPPDNTEILRISKDGIWANPDVPADDAAQAVLRAIDGHIKQMIERVQNKEREACALIVEQAGADGYGTLAAAAMIRRGGKA